MAQNYLAGNGLTGAATMAHNYTADCGTTGLYASIMHDAQHCQKVKRLGTELPPSTSVAITFCIDCRMLFNQAQRCRNTANEQL
jgi:hypothetical protein